MSSLSPHRRCQERVMYRLFMRVMDCLIGTIITPAHSGFPSISASFYGDHATHIPSLSHAHTESHVPKRALTYTQTYYVSESWQYASIVFFFLASNIYHFSFFSSSHQGVYYRKVPFTLPQLIFFEKPVGQNRSVIHLFS